VRSKVFPPASSKSAASFAAPSFTPPFITVSVAAKIVQRRFSDNMKRYVVTGAPGAGKTAIIRQLETDGFGVVEEAATDVIGLWHAQGITEPWTHPGFIEAILCLQQSRERRAACTTDTVQFHDRSVVCTAALADYLRFPRPPKLLQELRRVREENVFQNRVLFLKNLGFVTPTEARRITYEETVRFEKIHERTYTDLGFDIASIDRGSVWDRVKLIKLMLSLEGTIPI
jgi:predicted ATPase